MFPRLLSLFVLALTSLSSLAIEEVFSIQYESSNKTMCLGVQGSIANNSEVAIYPCVPAGQSWKLDRSIVTQVELTGNDPFCIGIESKTPMNGAPLIIQTCKNESQVWKYDLEKMHFKFQLPTNNSNNTMPDNHDMDYCMTLKNSSTATNTTTGAQIAECKDNDPEQKWVLAKPDSVDTNMTTVSR